MDNGQRHLMNSRLNFYRPSRLILMTASHCAIIRMRTELICSMASARTVLMTVVIQQILPVAAPAFTGKATKFATGSGRSRRRKRRSNFSTSTRQSDCADLDFGYKPRLHASNHREPEQLV